jgi:hypothetical protein
MQPNMCRETERLKADSTRHAAKSSYDYPQERFEDGSWSLVNETNATPMPCKWKWLDKLKHNSADGGPLVSLVRDTRQFCALAAPHVMRITRLSRTASPERPFLTQPNQRTKSIHLSGCRSPDTSNNQIIYFFGLVARLMVNQAFWFPEIAQLE